MKVRFHRSRSFELILVNPRDESRRGFFFEMIAGITAPVNHESGMTVNLILVDAWLDETLAELQKRSFASAAEILFVARSILRPLWAARAEVRDFELQLRHRQATFSMEEASDEISVMYRWNANRPDENGVWRPCVREASLRGPMDGVDEGVQFLRDFATESEGLMLSDIVASKGQLPVGLHWKTWREERADGRQAMIWEF